MEAGTQLNETSPALIAALREATGKDCYELHTGGGVMVAVVDVAGKQGLGKQVWLTREENWLLGFYDFGADVEDEGACVYLILSDAKADDAGAVAAEVAAILKRVS